MVVVEWIYAMQGEGSEKTENSAREVRQNYLQGLEDVHPWSEEGVNVRGQRLRKKVPDTEYNKELRYQHLKPIALDELNYSPWLFALTHCHLPPSMDPRAFHLSLKHI